MRAPLQEKRQERRRRSGAGRKRGGGSEKPLKKAVSGRQKGEEGSMVSWSAGAGEQEAKFRHLERIGA